MPEATVLYSVTAVIVAGLVIWVATVLKTAKEPWARDLSKLVELARVDASGSADAPHDAAGSDALREDDVAAEAAAAKRESADKIDADSTSPATPLALSEGKVKAREATSSDAASDAAAEESAAQSAASEEDGKDVKAGA